MSMELSRWRLGKAHECEFIRNSVELLVLEVEKFIRKL